MTTTKINLSDIQRCPFCGGPGKPEVVGGERTNYVKCNDCSARGPASAAGASITQLVGDWNNRWKQNTIEAHLQLQAKIEELTTALHESQAAKQATLLSRIDCQKTLVVTQLDLRQTQEEAAALGASLVLTTALLLYARGTISLARAAEKSGYTEEQLQEMLQTIETQEAQKVTP